MIRRMTNQILSFALLLIVGSIISRILFKELQNVMKKVDMPITGAARSKARNVFARSNTGVAGSNPTRGMDVCLRVFCDCVVLYR
jgi:hypothetical protein